jgi:LmbE family N-acetylglucosaminyl deacetylase
MTPFTLASANDPLVILCLGAHCDDIEIGCGATLLRLLAERPGSTVHWTVLASTPEREREARSSAEAFLADAPKSVVTINSFRESYFPYVAADIKDAFEGLKASVSPDLIFTHRRRDEHQDHRTVAELTWNTFRDHAIAEYEIPKYEGDLGHPNLYVPLSTEVAERKIDLLFEHFTSQLGRSWFRKETFRGMMAVRGVECNAKSGFAEAFHVRKIVI